MIRKVDISATPDYKDNKNYPYKWEIRKEEILEDYGWSESLDIAFKDAKSALNRLQEGEINE